MEFTSFLIKDIRLCSFFSMGNTALERARFFCDPLYCAVQRFISLLLESPVMDFRLCIEQCESDDRQQDIGPQNGAGVSRSHIVRGKNLVNMTSRRAQQEKGGRDKCCDSEGQVLSKSYEACHTYAKAGKPHFQLKGAVCPPNEFRRILGKHHMHQEIVYIPDPDAEQEKIGNKGFDNDRLTQGPFLEIERHQ